MKIIILTCLLVICVSLFSQPDTYEKNKTAITAIYEGFNKRDYSVLEKYYTPDYVDHTPAFGGDSSPDGVKKGFENFQKAFPDYQMSVEDIIVTGDKASVRLLVTATNTGELSGKPPTNKKVEVTGLNFFIFRDGKISERWGYYDTETLYKQLGIGK